MGTEILHPQDHFIERLRSVPSISPSTRRPTYGNPNPKSCRKHSLGPDPKKRDPKKCPHLKNHVLRQVSILNRGESLNFNKKGHGSFDDRDLVVSVSQSDVYAGSAFSQSPSPSSLPLPTFSRKKEGLAIVDESATIDLRRLLRIG